MTSYSKIFKKSLAISCFTLVPVNLGAAAQCFASDQYLAGGLFALSSVFAGVAAKFSHDASLACARPAP